MRKGPFVCKSLLDLSLSLAIFLSLSHMSFSFYSANLNPQPMFTPQVPPTTQQAQPVSKKPPVPAKPGIKPTHSPVSRPAVQPTTIAPANAPKQNRSAASKFINFLKKPEKSSKAESMYAGWMKLM